MYNKYHLVTRDKCNLLVNNFRRDRDVGQLHNVGHKQALIHSRDGATVHDCRCQRNGTGVSRKKIYKYGLATYGLETVCSVHVYIYL